MDLGNFQKWFVYVSDPSAALVWDKESNSMASEVSTNGFVRIAILPPLKDADSVDRAFRFLLRHAPTYPTGAEVDLSYRDQSGIMTYRFSTDGISGTHETLSSTHRVGWWSWPTWIFTGSWGDRATNSGGNEGETSESPSLLMYALPHHIKAFGKESQKCISEEGLAVLPSIYSLKGRLTPTLGSAWSMIYTLAEPGWYYNMHYDVPSEQLDIIVNQLTRDITETKKETPATDSYNFGKEVSRVAMLAGSADYLGILDMRDQAIEILQTWLTPWLEGTNEDKLLYDKSYGGVVTKNGIGDKMADFGMGWYNDHHFHFGYHIHAYATTARFNKVFLAKHKEAMEVVVADVCNYRREEKENSLMSVIKTSSMGTRGPAVYLV